MTLPPAVATAAANAGRWALRRLQERSTYAGIAMLLASIGYAELGREVDHVGAVLVALGVVGTGLAAATTTPHLPPPPAG